MDLPNIFTATLVNAVVERLNQLKSTSRAHWGKMTVDQMLAHCNVAYEMVFENKHSKPNFFVRILLKLVVKKIVVATASYKKNSKTAPAFIVTDARNFEKEKERLIAYIRRVQELGETYFHNNVSHSFGKLTKNEWNNLFYKHLDHHLKQFGV